VRRAAKAKHQRRRGKRNLMGLLDSFVSGVSKQMQDLIQESNNSTAAFTQAEVITVKASFVNKGIFVFLRIKLIQQPSSAQSEPLKCRMTESGSVNCSRAVYQNSKQWRRSKQEIDAKISELKDQLDTLKVSTNTKNFFFSLFHICLKITSVFFPYSIYYLLVFLFTNMIVNFFLNDN